MATKKSDDLEVLAVLTSQLGNATTKQLNVIPWAAPVVSFGSLTRSKVATLGLNPSNREFVDVHGRELIGSSRRFHSLRSLGIKRWADASDDHFRSIMDSCNNYFNGNPYDSWFRALDKLLVGSKVSYYGSYPAACHLDLVPYATACKWFELSCKQRANLLSIGGDALGMLLRHSSVDVLILNGRSVIQNLEVVSGSAFVEEPIARWTLPRSSGGGVIGFAYSGTISRVSDIDLGREISVLGYSHNIQSSFGVTTAVKTAIADWITESIGALCLRPATGDNRVASTRKRTTDIRR